MAVLVQRRSPRPSLEGRYSDARATAILLLEGAGIQLPRPTVGTAWNLGGMSLGLVLPGAYAGPGILARATMNLLLNGNIIDTFGFVWSDGSVGFPPATDTQDPNVQEVGFHPYQPGYTIYDTDTLTLKMALGGINASGGVPTTVGLEWKGNVTYL